jgi:hypothetical protein
MALTPRSIIRDASGLFELIHVLSDTKASEELLKQLSEQAEKSVSADTHAAELLQQVEQREKELVAREQSLKQGEADLAIREASLKDAEQQHQAKMASEQKAFAQRQGDLNAVMASKNREYLKVGTDLDARTRDLDRRDKALAKRELDAVRRDEALTAREQALAQAQAKHAKKVAVLNEMEN